MKKVFLVILMLGLGVNSLAQCGDTTHNNIIASSWSSCEKSQNPNIIHGESHWILYDFAFEYQLAQTHFWNLNSVDQTQDGIHKVIIDFSTDAISWTTLGSFEFPKATGTEDYTGFHGPDFENTHARYVLLTVLSTHGNGDCAGLSEVKFFLTDPNVGQEEWRLEEAQILIYPNPVKDQLNFSWKGSDEVVWSIQSITGETIQHGKSLNNSELLNVSALESGMYILSLQTSEGLKFNERFIKLP